MDRKKILLVNIATNKYVRYVDRLTRRLESIS